MRREIQNREKQVNWTQGNRDAHSSGLKTENFVERHYTVAEIAEIWQLSHDAIRRMFHSEPGVLVLGSRKQSRRRYTTLRIPESVLQRVHRRLMNV